MSSSTDPGTRPTGRDDPAAALERAYRLILGRSPDAEGAAGYLHALRSGELSLPEVCARLAGSDEFAHRLHPAGRGGTAADDPGRVDAAELVDTVTVEELAERADDYFRAVDDPRALLAKPLSGLAETPELLVTFGQVLRGLAPLPGMSVLDFGAGTCWTSRFLAQLGCRVTALDVSPSALDLGRRLFAEQPLLGDRPEPEFLAFDGRRFELPDASIDRVLSFDALHHVPNPAEVLREMARVLRPGGVAAFAEPGDRHSVQAQSQYEMRSHGILESDIVIEDVWAWARRAGFAELRLCLLDSDPAWVDIDTFHDVVAGREQGDAFLGPARAAIADRRMFTLRREGTEVPDSRAAGGLVAELAVDDVQVGPSGAGTAATGSTVTGTCRVHNPGPRTWLPSDASFGPVSLGARLHRGDGTARDLARIPLPGRGIEPGTGARFTVHVEFPDGQGAAAVEFDLVSENVCWFAVNGSPTVTVPLTPPG